MTATTGRTDKQREQRESQQLVERLLASMPAATFEMETLCRLAGIEATRSIPTAAVECKFRPRLLINPDFVAMYCARHEHFFLLVMHELWHILFAHTQMYPRMTMLQNIAFDAIINAGLARQFDAPEYRGFFESLNSGDTFPGCFLRPPEGWPDNPVYPDLSTEKANDLLRRLYPPAEQTTWSPPLYQEILDLLEDDLREKIARGEVMIVPILLGDHTDEESDKRALDDPVMRDILGRMTANWDIPDFGGNQRSGGSALETLNTTLERTSEQTRRAFANVLRRAISPTNGRLTRRAKMLIPGTSGLSPMLNPRDRFANARQALGVQGLLWNQPGMIHARAPQHPGTAHIYLDVSGSMVNLLPHLLGLILPYVAQREVQVFQFSTEVEPLTYADLKKGDLNSTGGTSINCVLKHALKSQPRLKRIIILTDGRVGKPNDELVWEISNHDLRLHVVLPHESVYRDDLGAIARSVTVLPPLLTTSSRSSRNPFGFDPPF